MMTVSSRALRHCVLLCGAFSFAACARPRVPIVAPTPSSTSTSASRPARADGPSSSSSPVPLATAAVLGTSVSGVETLLATLPTPKPHYNDAELDAFIAVLKNPGATPFTWMLCGASSTASARVSILSAPLLVA